MLFVLIFVYIAFVVIFTMVLKRFSWSSIYVLILHIEVINNEGVSCFFGRVGLYNTLNFALGALQISLSLTNTLHV